MEIRVTDGERAGRKPRWRWVPLMLALATAKAAAQEEPTPNPPPTAGAPAPEPPAPVESNAPPVANELAPTPPAAEPEAALSSEAAAPDAATSEASVNELGAVIVSARRRNESVQEVPVPISVLSGDSLETKGAVNLQSFHKEVPSITSYSSNQRNTTINIRGLGTGIAASGNGLDSGVGFYVDDVYYARLSQTILNLVDIDRIEVLRGPQGTLFGRNSTAGAISVVTRQPSFTREGFIDLSGGNYGFLQARGSLSGPILKDKLAARVSFEAARRDGYLYDIQQLSSINNSQSFTIRGQALYKPTDKLKFRVIADFAKTGQSCCTLTPIAGIEKYDNGTPVAYPWSARVAQLSYRPLAYDPEQRLADADRQRTFRVTSGGVSLRADWDLGPATLTSISALRFWNTRPRNDNDGTSLDIIRENNADDRQKQATEELRLASNGSRAIDYVVGLYGLYQTIPTLSRMDYGPQAGEYYIAPGTNDLTPEQRRDTLNGMYTRQTYTANTLAAAPFVQATWHILSSLDLTAGLRDTWERKWGDYQQTRGNHLNDLSALDPAQSSLLNTYAGVVPRYELDKSWNNLSGTVTLAQKLAESALVFGTYSRGSKSGGINLANLPKDADGNAQKGLAILKPETVDHFEIGLKSQWWHRRFTANISLFRTQIRDYQSTVADRSGPVILNYLSNVGKVRSQGVEVELRATPIRGLNLYAAGTFNPTEYLSYKSAQCPWETRAPGQSPVCDLSGQQLPVAPKWAGSAGGDWTFSITEGLRFFLGADVSYRSSYTTTFNNSRYSRLDPVTLVNARLGLKDGDGHWEALIWSQNLLDSLYFLAKSIQDEQNGRQTGLLGDPRTFGGNFRYYFD